MCMNSTGWTYSVDARRRPSTARQFLSSPLARSTSGWRGQMTGNSPGMVWLRGAMVLLCENDQETRERESEWSETSKGRERGRVHWLWLGPSPTAGSRLTKMPNYEIVSRTNEIQRVRACWKATEQRGSTQKNTLCVLSSALQAPVVH